MNGTFIAAFPHITKFSVGSGVVANIIVIIVAVVVAWVCEALPAEMDCPAIILLCRVQQHQHQQQLTSPAAAIHNALGIGNNNILQQKMFTSFESRPMMMMMTMMIIKTFPFNSDSVVQN